GCQIEGGVAVRPATKLSLVLALPNGYPPVVVDRTIVVWSDGNRFGLRHELLLPKDLLQLERLLDDSDTNPQLPGHRRTSLSTRRFQVGRSGITVLQQGSSESVEFESSRERDSLSRA